LAVVFLAALVFLAGDFFVVLATAPVTDLTALLTRVGALVGFFLAVDFFAAVFLAGDFLAAVFCAAGTVPPGSRWPDTASASSERWWPLGRLYI
jgi:hypothetical protein